MANWASIDRLGNPADAAWQRDNLVTIEPVPGQRWQVYREAAPSYQGFLSELAATGYPLASSGGFNYRNIRGSDRLSQHAFGTAIDLNAAANPRVAPGGAVVTDLPANVGEIAAKYGLEWGGNWKRPDAMHFEWSGKDAGSTPSIGSMYASAAPTPAAAPAGPVASLAPQATALMSGGAALALAAIRRYHWADIRNNNVADAYLLADIGARLDGHSLVPTVPKACWPLPKLDPFPTAPEVSPFQDRP